MKVLDRIERFARERIRTLFNRVSHGYRIAERIKELRKLSDGIFLYRTLKFYKRIDNQKKRGRQMHKNNAENRPK